MQCVFNSLIIRSNNKENERLNETITFEENVALITK